jgi:replicative DNA helicase
MELAVRLPQHPQTERAILGAVIVDNTALTMASQVLSVCDFSVVAHRHIFAAMLSLAARAEPIELLSLWDVLSDNSEVIAAGGAAFIASLGDRVHRDAPIDHWARMVKNAAILRQMAYEGESLTRAALEPHAETEEIAKRVQTLPTRFVLLSAAISLAFSRPKSNRSTLSGFGRAAFLLEKSLRLMETLDLGSRP